jgi:predicted tellurium resistance membrane protein TerC
MDWMTTTEGWIALVTLASLEIILGIDNIVFISILSGRLPKAQRDSARLGGLGVAMVSRIALLLSLTWVMRLTTPLFDVLGQEISGRDLILIVGGLFLLGKATHEIHVRLEGEDEASPSGRRAATLRAVLVQILLLDLIFSLDSVVTAVGMVDDVAIMITAIMIAVIIMMLFSGIVNDFIHRHPTIKMLALSFLLLIGVTLIAEGLGQHISKGYIYFAMAFSVFVETLNLRLRHRPVTAEQ